MKGGLRSRLARRGSIVVGAVACLLALQAALTQPPARGGREGRSGPPAGTGGQAAPAPGGQSVGTPGQEAPPSGPPPPAPERPPDRVLSRALSLPGFEVPAGQRWAFDPAVSTTVEVAANVVVKGTLEMRPASSDVVHTLRFVGVDESRFAGGGDAVLPSDVGLWVIGSGGLDLWGTPKTGWLRTAQGVPEGATSLTMERPPRGWRAGDEVVIAPTEAPTSPAFSDGFDAAAIASLSGVQLQVAQPASRPHPKVEGRWAPEVANLTRNVQIEGTPSGRSHVWIKSSSPQTIRYVALRWMGANRAYRAGDGLPVEEVLGRYPIHFHRSGDGSRGSIVEGVVVRDSGGHAFVPHESHGVTFRDTVAFDVFRTPYWWDLDTTTHDTVWEHALAAGVRHTADFKFRLAGFGHDAGDGNVVRDSVAVGVQPCDCDDDGGGFSWPEHGGVWTFENNVAHNNAMHGIFVWQNNDEPHVVANFTGFYNAGYGMEHGAYANAYHYVGGWLFGNRQGAIQLDAVSTSMASGRRLEFRDLVMDGAGLSDSLVVSMASNLPTDQATLFQGVEMRGHTGQAFHFTRPAATLEGAPLRELYEVAYSTVAPNEFWLECTIHPDSLITVRPDPSSVFYLRRCDQQGTSVPAWNARRR